MFDNFIGSQLEGVSGVDNRAYGAGLCTITPEIFPIVVRIGR